MKNYLTSVTQQFKHYKKVAERTFSQVSDEQLLWQYNEASNSIGTLVKHLSGNMLSRWTDFLNSDGEKEWRERDAEFENDIDSREELLKVWNKGWECLFAALDELTEKDLKRAVKIRDEKHTVVEAINRQFAHYSYHIGQIVLLGKMLAGDDWKSLSIPKGQSRQYNEKKFSESKSKQRFTEE